MTTATYPCSCGVVKNERVGEHRCSCGAQARVIRNGDAGFHVVLKRGPATPKFVVRNGEIQHRRPA